MTRIQMVAGNWKMRGIKETAHKRLTQLQSKMQGLQKNTEVVVCTPFTLIDYACTLTNGSNINIGAQDCHYEIRGAHTGDISPSMLKDLGCLHVILGHSERRASYNETSNTVSKKVALAVEKGLTAIVCIGETEKEKDAGKTLDVLKDQITHSLPKNVDTNKIVVAYEPIWAIGTGRVPTIEDIQNIHSQLRKFVAENFSQEVADKMRLLYGGSVNAKNSAEILALKDVDGALVGGASLEVDDFFTIISNAK